MAKENEPKGVRVLFPDEAKDYIKRNAEGSYTLLDVRQPFEYEEARLPGAKLIPLPNVADSLETLDRHQPVLVYCAVGGRSRMAAQLLSNQGFEAVYQIQGGIDAWEAPTASGPVSFHLRHVKGDEPPQEVIGIAYYMEEGLRKFHQEIQSRTVDKDLHGLLTVLIKAEESHKQALTKLLEKLNEGQQAGGIVESSPGLDPDLMEGGIEVAAFIQQNERYLQSVSGYLELAMMIETQALDLYLRMASESANAVTKEVLFRVSEEEKAHLAMLGQYLDRNQEGVS